MRLRSKQPPREFWKLNGMLRSWHDLVAEVETGYDDVIEEYWNDLSVRDLLEELIAVVPEGSVRAWVTKEVEQTDLRYRAATDPRDKPIFGSGEMAWWWMRVPKVLKGELLADFENGLADER